MSLGSPSAGSISSSSAPSSRSSSPFEGPVLQAAKKRKNNRGPIKKAVYVPPHRRPNNFTGPVQQVPKSCAGPVPKGMFYGEHDDRIDSDEYKAAAGQDAKKRVLRSEATHKWGHDKFLERDSNEKLVSAVLAYGIDIRIEDNAPLTWSRKRRREEEFDGCNETQFSKKRNQRNLILEKKGSLGMNIPDILLQKHFLPQHEYVSAEKALELSKNRFNRNKNTVFENPSKIWKCTVVQDDSGLVSPETEVYVSDKRLQTYQCYRDLNQLNQWIVEDLGMNYAVFGTDISDYHFIDESLDADVVLIRDPDPDLSLETIDDPVNTLKTET